MAWRLRHRREMEPIAPSLSSPDAPRMPVGSGRARLWQDEEFSFGDILDAINPLQHLPVIGTLYRAITGDKIGPVPRLIGDLVFGGPLGFVSAIIAVGVENETGKDPGEHLLAWAGELFADPSSTGPVYAEAKPDAAPGVSDRAAERVEAPPERVALAEPPPPAATVSEPAEPDPGPAPAIPLSRLGVDVKPDHPPMPLFRTGGSLPVAQTAYVPLQSATVIPRPAVFAARAEPVDVPRQMMEALDKYARMQTARGTRVDLEN